MPYQLVEGISYTIKVSVRNKSTRSGVLVEANLTIDVTADTPSGGVFLKKTETHLAPAGGSVVMSVGFTTPAGTAGQTGTIRASVMDPTGNVIRTASDTLTIVRPAATLYGKVTVTGTTTPVAGVKVVLDGVVVSTNADGNYSLPAYAGTYRLTFTKDGFEPTIYETITLTPGDNLRNIWLVPSPTATANLTGVVKDSQGLAPVPGVKVTLTAYRADALGNTYQVYYETLSGSTGVYTFTGVLTMGYAISFIKEGYAPKVTSVNLVAGNNQFNTEITPVSPNALTLYFTNSKIGATVWDAKIYDPATGQTVGPTGIKEPHIPIVLVPPGNSFFLYVMEQRYGGSALWYGPYAVTVPGMGSYTWNSAAGTISGGGSSIGLPFSDNESLVTALIQSVYAYQEEEASGSSISLLIQQAQDVPGKVNAVKYFIGKSILIINPDMPVDWSYGQAIPGLKVGKIVYCRMKMVWIDYPYYRAEWRVSDFEYPMERPPEDYEFQGTFNLSMYFPYPYAIYPVYDLDYAVSGNVPVFRVVIVQRGVYSAVTHLDTQGGPTISGKLVGLSSGAGYNRALYVFAHPDPNAIFSWAAKDVDRWKQVGYWYLT